MAGILNIQIKPIIGKTELNLKKINHYIKKYSNKKLDLVVMPEFFSTGIDHNSFINNPTDENGSEIIKYISKLAKEYNTNIIAGTVIEKSEDKLYNTSFAINREGNIVAKYRKIHLYQYMGGTEGDNITPGDKEIVVDFDFGKVGMAICFDIRYPLHYKRLAKLGADIIVSPTAWVITNEIYKDIDALKYAQEMWIAMNRVRAYDNGVYLISSNQTKQVNDKISTIGNSLIISPTAEVIANAKNDECAIWSDIDLDLVKYLRQTYPIAQID